MKIKWSYKAVKQIGDIRRYIAGDDDTKAYKFCEFLEKRIGILKTFPLMGRPGEKAGTRELTIHKNYKVIYQVDKKHVEILSVFHVAMNRQAFFDI